MIDYSLLAANDNGIGDDECPPVVIPDDRPDHAYARSGNLILPLRFAQRLPGWNAAGIELIGRATTW